MSGSGYALVVLFAINLMNFFDRQLLGGVGEGIRREWALSDTALPVDDWRISLVVFAAIAVPALVGMLSRRWNRAIAIVAAMVSCPLLFFVASNFAVWAFS